MILDSHVINFMVIKFHLTLRRRQGGLMVGTKEHYWGSLHCVSGQDAVLTLFLSPPRCINWYWLGEGDERQR